MSNQISDYELCDLYYTARLEFSRRFGIGAKTESHTAGLRAVADHAITAATPVFDEEAMPKADAERVALLGRIDNTIQAIEFGGIPSRELMRDIRAYLGGA